jgi:hypothetical protein
MSPVDRSSGVRSDHTVILTASESAKVYPDALRRVVLVAIVRKRRRLEVSSYQILQILSPTLFEKMPILWALEVIDSQNELGGDPNQLILFEF